MGLLANRIRQGLHAFRVDEANNAALGKNGSFCIADTNMHYGDYYAIFFITDTSFATLTEGLPNANGIAFTSGGTHVISVGEIIRGRTSGAKAVVNSVTVTSGSFAGGNAVGVLGITLSGSTNFTAGETIDIYTAENMPIALDVCTTATEANGGATAPEAMTGRTFYAGSTIFGNFTAIKLSSGSILAYKA